MNSRFLGAYLLAGTLGLLSTASSDYPQHLASITLIDLPADIGMGAREPALLMPGPSLRWTDSQSQQGLDYHEGEWRNAALSKNEEAFWAKGVLQLNAKTQNQGIESSVTSYRNGVLVGSMGGFLGWAPSQAIDSDGNQHLVFDRYRNGDFEVIYLDPEQQVEHRLSRSSAMEAHSTIAVDSLDRIWIAWDEADASWGNAGGLHQSRQLRLVMHDANGWHQVRLPT